MCAPDTVLFDLDGTILDTLDDLTAAVCHALGVLKRRDIGRDIVRRFVGNGVKKLLLRALLYTDGREPDSCGEHADFDVCYKSFTEYYDIHNADNTVVYPGVNDVLLTLKARGIKTAVVTNKYDEAAQALKKRLFNSVDVVVGARQGIRPKPARDGVDCALALLGRGVENAIFVGDGETDIATAKNAGLPVIAVTWGFRDRALLESLGPDRIIDEPHELLEIIDGAIA